MPTYLTPGVYVEEVPSANKPIEGVGTSIAAFVGLAPGGPVNTPMRISNWTQFAKIFGDPNNPDNGPFMEGAYLAHSVYGFFQNGGSICWIVRVGESNGGGSRPQAALPAAADDSPSRPSAPRRCPKVDGTRQGRADRGAQGAATATPTYKLVVTSGSEREEYEGLTAQEGPLQPRHQGQRLLEADQDRGHRRVAARRAEGPGDRHATRCRRRRPSPSDIKPNHFEGDEAQPARAWAAWRPSTRSRWSSCRTCDARVDDTTRRSATSRAR